MGSSLAKVLSNTLKWLGTRNVRVPSKGLAKGMGITRKGAVKKLKGGKRILMKPSGGTTFLKKSAKLGPARGTKIGAGVAGTGAVVAGLKTMGPKPAVTKAPPVTKKGYDYSKDIAVKAKSGYHKFKKGSRAAKEFQKAYSKNKGRKFFWGVTQKWYQG